LKPSSLIWVRLNSVPVIRAVKPAVARAFIAGMVGHPGKLKSLDDLEPHALDTVNHLFAHSSNEQLEARFLEFLKGPK
jgi:hypothetical protein